MSAPWKIQMQLVFGEEGDSPSCADGELWRQPMHTAAYRARMSPAACAKNVSRTGSYLAGGVKTSRR